jgi:tetratricopeptide (TPR) repeat protein
VQENFNLGVKLLHSFEYDEAEKVFATIIDQQPDCAMAYWGVAMSNFHPLWTPPLEAELKKGSKAIEIAQSINDKTEREAAYINAIATFYKDWPTVDHRTRCLSFEKTMEDLYKSYPKDKETAIFYALALNAAADPSDKTFTKQKKAGTILNELYPEGSDHPGIVHYIIHTYDSPELAHLALPAAKRYASVAPSSAHALHMPSHIFTRLGLWKEGIHSNLASVASAQCYADSAGIKGHWDEELHGMDYLVYGYLQQGDNVNAKKQWEYLNSMKEVHPVNFKVAYAFAAIPSRYVLENKMWKEAANLKVNEELIKWENHQWQKAIVHFARLLGSVHTNDIQSAEKELSNLKNIHQHLLTQKDSYKANQVNIQLLAGEAWIAFSKGKHNAAVTFMNEAVKLEDGTEKHPVTPGEVVPARELLGDLLLAIHEPVQALQAYEADLKKHPNRFNGLYGAGVAAEKAGNLEKAKQYYAQLNAMAAPVNSKRPELIAINGFLSKN